MVATAKRARTSATAAPLTTTTKQRGGVTGRGFLPGQSGNPGGRPRSERKVLEARYGEAGEKLYAELHALLADRNTPPKLKAHILCFLIERLHGRAQQRVEVDAGLSILEVLAAASARVEG
jgi:hypothetical protein